MFKEHTEGETWTLSDCPGVCGQRYSCNIREVWTVGAARDAWLGQRACVLERVCRLSLVLSCNHVCVPGLTGDFRTYLQDELGRKCTVCQTLPLIFTVLSY